MNDLPRPLNPEAASRPSFRAALLLLLASAALLRAPAVRAETNAPPVRGDVVILYNSEMPESSRVAEHYAARRGVPEANRVGLPLPVSETMSRAEFERRLLEPLVKELDARGLMTVRADLQPATESSPGRVIQSVTGSTIRYLAVCHGVPLRVVEDTSWPVEEAVQHFPKQLQRNEAAVDAELSAMPLLIGGAPRSGPLVNLWHGTTNAAVFTPEKGLLVVGRLDGPTPERAMALVDLAMEAEENGLLGRGYFDLRGTSDPAYQPGDRWISNAWHVVTRYGFETSLDTAPATLPPDYPLSHVAFYAGWYDQHVSGPFALPQVEFMPGAIAYHLHSFSAATLRSTNRHWAGPLVAKGVTATMGMVAEPYLDGTPDIGLCLARLLFSGFTWGEAALASQRMLSWQLTVIGDPLYRPFSMNALDRAKQLAASGQGRVDWALITLYNRKLEASGDLPGILKDLANEPRLRISALLQEKFGDLLIQAGEPGRAAEAYRRATIAKTSPQQHRRLLWKAGRALEDADEPRKAYEFYEALTRVRDFPTDRRVYERLQALAKSLGREKDALEWAAELNRLTGSENESK